MKLYLVMKAVSSMAVNGQICNLLKGEYILPAFSTLEKAKEHFCDGKFQISVVEAEETIK